MDQQQIRILILEELAKNWPNNTDETYANGFDDALLVY